MMRLKLVLFVTLFVFSGLNLSLHAGIGDGTGPFDSNNSGSSQENNSTFSNDNANKSIFSSGNPEDLFDTPPGGSPPENPPEPSVPLDGGTVLLVLLGTAIGFSRIIKNQINVFPQR